MIRRALFDVVGLCLVALLILAALLAIFDDPEPAPMHPGPAIEGDAAP